LRGYLRHLLQDQFNDLCLFFGIIQLAFVNAERFRSLYQRSDFRGLELCELSRDGSSASDGGACLLPRGEGTYNAALPGESSPTSTSTVHLF
jgi:hypothetical protein